MKYGGQLKGSYSPRFRARSGFKCGIKAAKNEGWKPFTKMSDPQHDIFKTAYREGYIDPEKAP